MVTKKAPATAFKPGQSGNPAGKPKGARNHATRAILKLIEGGAEEITLAVLGAAKGGDMGAARFILERIVPTAKERPVSLSVPDVSTPAGISEAQAGIFQAVADGELTPTEGSTLTSILETRRKALETEELERRIAALETKK